MGVITKQVKLSVIGPLAMSSSYAHFCQGALHPHISSGANEHLAWLSKMQQEIDYQQETWEKSWCDSGIRIRTSEGVIYRSHAET